MRARAGTVTHHHVRPFAVAPQLDHVIANLELMPLRLNPSKKVAGWLPRADYRNDYLASLSRVPETGEVNLLDEPTHGEYWGT